MEGETDAKSSIPRGSISKNPWKYIKRRGRHKQILRFTEDLVWRTEANAYASKNKSISIAKLSKFREDFE